MFSPSQKLMKKAFTLKATKMGLPSYLGQKNGISPPQFWKNTPENPVLRGKITFSNYAEHKLYAALQTTEGTLLYLWDRDCSATHMI